ncbi:MAG: serine--tRNA ligase, partial [Desulfonatronovibrio sp.]
MLDIKFIRKNPELVARSLKKRRSDLDVDYFLHLDQKRREIIQKTEELKMERNKASSEVGRAKKEGRDAGEILAGLGELSARIKEMDTALKQVDEEVHAWIMSAPNIVHEDV